MALLATVSVPMIKFGKAWLAGQTVPAENEATGAAELETS